MGFIKNNTSELDRIRKQVRADAKKTGTNLTRAQEASRVLKAAGLLK